MAEGNGDENLPEEDNYEVTSILIENPEEEQMEIEELNKETIDSKKIMRCKKCRRMQFGHPLPWGENYSELNQIEDDDELEKDNLIKNIQRKIVRKKKETKT